MRTGYGMESAAFQRTGKTAQKRKGHFVNCWYGLWARIRVWCFQKEETGMTEREEILENMIQDVMEHALKEHREKDMPEEEAQDRKSAIALSEQVEACLDTLEEEKRDLIDEYLSAVRSVNWWDYKVLYRQGVRDGVELMKWIDGKERG